MKKYVTLMIGILMFVIAMIWMTLSQSSTGAFLFLAAMSGVMIGRGIRRIRTIEE